MKKKTATRHLLVTAGDDGYEDPADNWQKKEYKASLDEEVTLRVTQLWTPSPISFLKKYIVGAEVEQDPVHKRIVPILVPNSKNKISMAEYRKQVRTGLLPGEDNKYCWHGPWYGIVKPLTTIQQQEISFQLNELEATKDGYYQYAKGFMNFTYVQGEYILHVAGCEIDVEEESATTLLNKSLALLNSIVMSAPVANAHADEQEDEQEQARRHTVRVSVTSEQILFMNQVIQGKLPMPAKKTRRVSINPAQLQLFVKSVID